MSKAASEDALGSLHKLVAESLTADLEDAANIEDPAVRATVVATARAQAIAFLKANSITASVEDNAGLRDLRAKLRDKQRNKVTPRQLQDAADAFGQLHGDPLQ